VAEELKKLSNAIQVEVTIRHSCDRIDQYLTHVYKSQSNEKDTIQQIPSYSTSIAFSSAFCSSMLFAAYWLG
jgi:hypothetical protein